MLMTPCPRAHLGPGWPGSWMRTPRRSSVGRFPANMCKCSPWLGLGVGRATRGEITQDEGQVLGDWGGTFCCSSQPLVYMFCCQNHLSKELVLISTSQCCALPLSIIEHFHHLKRKPLLPPLLSLCLPCSPPSPRQPQTYFLYL